MTKQVYSTRCFNCLFTRNRIVSIERMTEILDTCRRDNSSFTCHTSSPGYGDEPEDVMCAGYWDQEFSQEERDLAEIAGWVEFIERKADKLLICFDDQPKP